MLSSSKFTPLANAAGGVIVKALVPGRLGRPLQHGTTGFGVGSISGMNLHM